MKVVGRDMNMAQCWGEILPRDFAAAVKDIKVAILQARARAAYASNVEALNLYFYVGGYVSKKTRAAKWGSGAIDALSNRLLLLLKKGALGRKSIGEAIGTPNKSGYSNRMLQALLDDGVLERTIPDKPNS